MLGVEKVILEDKRLVGLGWTGPYEYGTKIPELFTRFESKMHRVKHVKDNTVLYAPFHDRATDFTYYVTLEVESFEDVPNDLIPLKMPKQEYASLMYEGSAEGVEQAYYAIFDWISQNGYSKDHSKLSLEKYLEEDVTINSSSDRRKFQMFVPIKKV